MTTQEKIDQLLNQNEILGKLIHEIVAIKPIQVNDRNVLAGVFLTKATKTHKAILTLCRSGYGEDASTLVRTLFDMLTNLKYMLSFENDNMIHRYFSYDDVLRVQMLETSIKNNPKTQKMFDEREANPKPTDESSKVIRKRAREAKEIYGYQNGWAPVNLADMSKKVGLQPLYDTVFRLYSQVIHTAPRVFNYYLHKNSDGGYTLDYNPSMLNVDDTLVGAFSTMFMILDTYCELTHAIPKDDLQKVFDDYIEIVDQINKSESEN